MGGLAMTIDLVGKALCKSKKMYNVIARRPPQAGDEAI